MKNFPRDKCEIQATKNMGKSCSFLDAIRRYSCARSANWLRTDGRENPVSNPVSTLETGWYATVLFAAQSSHLHFESFFAPPRIVQKATENKIYTSCKFCLLSQSFSHSLPLSTREHTREKIQVPSTQLIQAKVRKASVLFYFIVII